MLAGTGRASTKGNHSVLTCYEFAIPKLVSKIHSTATFGLETRY